MDSKLVVDKMDMLVSDVNPLFITVLFILLLVAFKILLILYARFLVTEASKFINIAVCHPIYYGKQLSGFNKFLWFLMTPILSVIFAFFLGIVIPIFVWVKFIQQVMGRIAYHFFSVCA